MTTLETILVLSYIIIGIQVVFFTFNEIWNILYTDNYTYPMWKVIVKMLIPLSSLITITNIIIKSIKK